jgi:protein gp37
MGAESKIEWCDHTFNAWWGCVRVSPGCEHCYAESFAKRTGHKVWGVEAPRRFFGDKHWEEPRKWDLEQEETLVRRRVFCGSMMDIFERPRDAELCAKLDHERLRLWKLIDETPGIDWLLLTKRPENAQACVPTDWWRDGFPETVWMGTTAEDQRRADERIHRLLKIPARARFLSCEPLLGPLDIRPYLHRGKHQVCPRCMFATNQPLDACPNDGAGLGPDIAIDWVIAGGESGPGARPMQLDWLRAVVDQCREMGTACFVKQFGARPMFSQTEGYARAIRGDLIRLRNRKGGDLTEIPGHWPREFPR